MRITSPRPSPDDRGLRCRRSAHPYLGHRGLAMTTVKVREVWHNQLSKKAGNPQTYKEAP